MTPNPYQGLLIAIGGIDGSGKSELANHLETRLRCDYGAVHLLRTKEPNKESFWGKKIYTDLADKRQFAKHKVNPFGFQAWYAQDSREHLCGKIVPFLSCENDLISRPNRGVVVLTDRFRESMCYGATYVIDVENSIIVDELKELRQMNIGIIGEFFIWPDLTIILDLETEKAIENLLKKGRELDGHENQIKLEGVKRNYREMVGMSRYFPNCVLVNNDADSILPAVTEAERHIRIIIEEKGWQGIKK